MTIISQAPAPVNSFISNIYQICIVTQDLKSTVQELTQRFGIGPFKCWDHTPKSLIDTEFRGKKSLWTAKIALAWIGDLQLEVVQPTAGVSLYNEFLDNHGEGVQHLLVSSDNLSFEETVQRFVATGFPVVQGGIVKVPSQVGSLQLPAPRLFNKILSPQFKYMDTETALKTAIELIKMPFSISYKRGCEMGKGDYWIPNDGAAIEAGLPNSFIDRLFKVGIVTHDLEETIKNYAERLGIGTWKRVDLTPSVIKDAKLRGETIEFSLRLAAAKIGETWLEVVQPLSGKSLYQEFLEQHGEGINYLGVCTDQVNFPETVHKFTALGCPVVMEGELKGAYRFAHFDTKPFIHTTLELISIPPQDILTALNFIS